MSEQHRWVYFSYARGRVAMRVEPKDEARVLALKEAIPEEDRFYKRNERAWCFNPQYCPEIVKILREHCAGYTIILEEQNADLLETLLAGPASLLKPREAPPKGRVFGMASELKESE